MDNQYIQFGEFITVDRKYVRVLRGDNKKWEEVKLVVQLRGIFLGHRTLFNGRLEYDYSDYGTTNAYFVQESSVKAILFCPGPRRNPFYVPLGGVVATQAWVRAE